MQLLHLSSSCDHTIVIISFILMKDWLKLIRLIRLNKTKLINLSFDTGRFAEAWKEALVLPSLKKPGLDFAFKNFRPVSNLSYISKLSERAGAEQFMEHLTANNLDSQLQTAYKQQHSTETALLKVKKDILMSMESNMSPYRYY